MKKYTDKDKVLAYIASQYIAKWFGADSLVGCSDINQVLAVFNKLWYLFSKVNWSSTFYITNYNTNNKRNAGMTHLLKSSVFEDMLKSITPSFIDEYSEVINKITEDMGMEPAFYRTVNKVLVIELYENLSAYRLFELDGNIYRVVADEIETPISRESLMQLTTWGTYKSYSEVLESEKEQILNDLKDMGVEDHYYDDSAFYYLGLYNKYLEEERYCCE